MKVPDTGGATAPEHMRIMHVSHRYAPEAIGGYESNCQRFAEEWVRRGHAVAVLTRQVPRLPRSGAALEGVQVFRVLNDVPPLTRPDPIRSRIYHLRIGVANRRNRRTTRDVVASWRPDVVVFWGMSAALIAPILAVRGLGMKCYFDLGDYWLAEALRIYRCPGTLRRSYRRHILLGGRIDPSMVDGAIVHSRFMRDSYVQAGLDPAALAVIHRGIEERFLHIGASRPLAPRQGPVRILCIGRLVPDKGALLLLQAFSAVEGHIPAVELHYFGHDDTEYGRQVAQECQKTGLLGRKIFMHGAQQHAAMPEIYATGDILAFPVLWDEPSSNVLLEAMAAGIPVVASRSGSNAEFVRDGETGILVECGDPRALGEALTQLCRQDGVRLRMGQAGRQRVLEAFQQRQAFDATEAYLRRALRPPPS